MKRLRLFGFLFTVTLWAAGDVQQNLQPLTPLPGGNIRLTMRWTGDATTGSVPVTGAVLSGLPGGVQGLRILQVETVPGTPAPTNGYNVELVDELGADMMAGALLGLSATQAQFFSASSITPPVVGTFSLRITGQSVAGAKGVVAVYIGPLTFVSSTAGTQGPAGPTGPAGSQGPMGGGLAPGNFTFSQTPGVPMSGGFAQTITLTPCPKGVNGTDSGHYLYVSGGVGAAEAVLLTGGSCVSEAASGTVIFTPVNSHSGSWTLSSATAGVQEALNTISTATGGVIFFTPGTYTFYKGVTIAAAQSRVTFQGSGESSVIFLAAGMTGAVFGIGAGPTSFLDLKVDGNRANQSFTSSESQALFGNCGTCRIVIDHCTFTNLNYNSVFQSNGATHSSVTNSQFLYNATHNIRFTGGTGNTYNAASNNIVQSQSLTVTNATNATPIVITTSTNHLLVNSQNITVTGVLGNTAANGQWIITRLTATTFSLNGSVGNGAYTSGGTTVDGGWGVQVNAENNAVVKGNQFTGGATEAIALVTNGSTISGNTSVASGDAGIVCTSCNGVIVADNSISTSCVNGLYADSNVHSVWIGNQVNFSGQCSNGAANQRNGMTIFGASGSNNLVAGNRLYANGSYGLYVGASITSTRIYNNSLEGNGSGNIFQDGTDVNTTIVDCSGAGASTCQFKGATLQLPGLTATTGLRIDASKNVISQNGGRQFQACSGVPTSSATLFLTVVPMAACTNTVEGATQFVLMPSAGTLQNLRVSTGSGLAGGTIAVTLRVGLVDTALTCTVAAGASTCFSTATAAAAAGDVISVKAVTGAGVTGSGILVSWDM